VTLLLAVQSLFQLCYMVLLVRMVLSWVPGVSLQHPAVQFVHRVTDPVLDPIRRVVPPVAGLDLSPLVAILLLSLIQRAVVGAVLQAAY